MARFNSNSIPYKTQEQLMDHFCKTISKLETPTKIKYFLKDVLNRKERQMIIRRLLIAEMLDNNISYTEIQKELRVGKATIARVSRWLHFGRGGYHLAISTKKEKG